MCSTGFGIQHGVALKLKFQIGPSPCDVGDSLWNTWMNQGP